MAYQADWAKRNPDKVAEKMWRHDLKRAYGITIEQWNEMLAEHGGRCAVCGTPDPRGRGRFHVDHCHATGRVRALLCSTCNVALGLVQDDPQLLRALAEYVEKHAVLSPA